MSIKFDKTKKLAKTGEYHQTFRKLWDALPESLKAKLTSSELATVIDVCYAQNNLGKKEMWNEMK